MSNESEGRQAASDFREEHHLGTQPLGDLVTIIEQATGHEVAVLEGDPDEHGLAMRDPSSGAIYIGVARTPHPMRQRSTLAHELAHVLFEDWGTKFEPTTRDPAEIRADAFARHLLIPSEGLKALLKDRRPITETELSFVVQRFLVSPWMAAIALCDNGYIDQETKDEWRVLSTFSLAARHGWLDHYQSLRAESDRLRPPQKLLARAIAGYEEGVVSGQTIATLRGISVEQVQEELTDAGIVPHAFDTPSMAASDLPEVNVDLSALDDPENEDHGG